MFLCFGRNVQTLDERLLAPQRDMLAGAAGGLPPDEPNLLGGTQPGLDHHHLFVESDDRRITLLPHRHGCLHPMAEGNTLHLDLFCDHGLVDDLLVLVDNGVHPHPIGQSLALADDGLLLDHGNNLAVVVEPVGWLLHVHPDVGP